MTVSEDDYKSVSAEEKSPGMGSEPDDTSVTVGLGEVVVRRKKSMLERMAEDDFVPDDVKQS